MYIFHIFHILHIFLICHTFHMPTTIISNSKAPPHTGVRLIHMVYDDTRVQAGNNKGEHQSPSLPLPQQLWNPWTSDTKKAKINAEKNSTENGKYTYTELTLDLWQLVCLIVIISIACIFLIYNHLKVGDAIGLIIIYSLTVNILGNQLLIHPQKVVSTPTSKQ